MILPIIVSSIGVIASIIGTFLVRTKEGASMNNLLWSFRIGIFGATILGLIGAGVYISAKGMDFNLLWVILFGNLLGIIVGTATEYFTSYEYKPVKWMASQSETGAASVIIAGIAVAAPVTIILPEALKPFSKFFDTANPAPVYP